MACGGGAYASSHRQQRDLGYSLYEGIEQAGYQTQRMEGRFTVGNFHG